VERHHQRDAVRAGIPAAATLGNPEVVAEKRFRGRRAECKNNRWRDEVDLLV
jgi:hypothetical protein